MANLNDLDDVTISNPRAGDVVKYTATGWTNAADATGTPPGGNPCGSMDGYLKEDEAATITEPWVWQDAGCPSITVEDTTGTFAGDKAEICSNKFIVRDANGKEGVFKARGTDGEVELRVNGGQLYFRDDVVTPPVRLAELVAGIGGSGATAFSPITVQFEIDEAASDKTNTNDWQLNSANSATFSFGSGWASNFPSGRAFNVVTATPRSITMPPGANAAIVFYQNIVTMGVYGDPELNPLGSERALCISHRVGITNATFPNTVGQPAGYTKTGFGITHKDIITLPGNEQSVVDNYRSTKSFNKFDLINFANNAVLTIEPRVDILKGGRGEFTTSAGRFVIIPFYSDSPTDFSVDTFGTDAGFYYSEDELNDIYDLISLPETPAESANISGREYRDLLRRIIVSLESRKAYPPVGGATEAEFNAQIQAAWALADNSTLQTEDEFRAALEVFYTEITKEKYGVAILFQFEIEAGNTLRGLL
jgi:hypothetical protein